LAAVPSIGRASRVEGGDAPEADLTRTLYEQYANQIFRYCLHQLGSREEAEDAVQSTFLNAFRGIRRGVVPESESAWLFKIAHNVCLSRRRSTWRRGRVESPADFDLVEERTPAPVRRSDELIGLQDVLEGMPENQRRAILLREWQGLSYREIAEELELTQAAVETLIFRARRSLAQGLEQPREPTRKRLARAADFGNIIAGIKSALVGGSAAVKVAATVAVVSGGTVVAAAPVQPHGAHRPLPPAPVSAPSPARHPASGTTLRTRSPGSGVVAASSAGGLRASAKRRGAQGFAATTPARHRAARTAVPDTAGGTETAAPPPQSPVEQQSQPAAAPVQPLVATPSAADKGKSETKGGSKDNRSGGNDESDHANSGGANSGGGNSGGGNSSEGNSSGGDSNRGGGNSDSNSHAYGKDAGKEAGKEAGAAVLTVATQVVAAAASQAPASTGPLAKKLESGETHGRSGQSNGGGNGEQAAAPATVADPAPAATGVTVTTTTTTTTITITTTTTTTAPAPSGQSAVSTPQPFSSKEKTAKPKGGNGNGNENGNNEG
jgi:RNA polymerase sigma factor (sigma-70 family)